MNIRAVIFDLDDTVVVEKASAEAAFLAACELARSEYGLDPKALHETVRRTCRELWHASSTHPYCKEIGISSWEGMWARFDGDDPNLKNLRKFAPVYRIQSWVNALAEFDIVDLSLSAELADAFCIERRKHHIVFDDVRAVLDELQKKYKLAIISNGAPDLQREKLAGSGVGAYFEAVVISGEHGTGKPDAKLFEIVLEHLDVETHEAIVIGNSRNTDILGAQNAGVKSVWLNRDNSDYESDVVADFEIASLDELGGILRKLQ